MEQLDLLNTREVKPSLKEQLELQRLCADYLAADQWGRDRIMATARRHAQTSPAPSDRQLRLVASTRFDQGAHLVNDGINLSPLTLVR